MGCGHVGGTSEDKTWVTANLCKNIDFRSTVMVPTQPRARCMLLRTRVGMLGQANEQHALALLISRMHWRKQTASDTINCPLITLIYLSTKQPTKLKTLTRAPSSVQIPQTNRNVPKHCPQTNTHLFTSPQKAPTWCLLASRSCTTTILGPGPDLATYSLWPK